MSILRLLGSRPRGPVPLAALTPARQVMPRSSAAAFERPRLRLRLKAVAEARPRPRPPRPGLTSLTGPSWR